MNEGGSRSSMSLIGDRFAVIVISRFRRCLRTTTGNSFALPEERHSQRAYAAQEHDKKTRKELTGNFLQVQSLKVEIDGTCLDGRRRTDPVATSQPTRFRINPQVARHNMCHANVRRLEVPMGAVCLTGQTRWGLSVSRDGLRPVDLSCRYRCTTVQHRTAGSMKCKSTDGRR